MNKKTIIICLLAGLVAFTFSSGVWNIPIMAWIYPIFFLFISRNLKTSKGVLMVFLAIVIGNFIKWPGFADFNSILDNLLATVFGVFIIVPYIIDRTFFPIFFEKNNISTKFVGTLIFPATLTTIEVLLNYFRINTSSILSYTQVENLPFIQIASIFGQYGLSFLIAWFSSTVCFIIIYLISSYGKTGKKLWLELKKPLCIFLVVYLAIFVYGGARLKMHQVNENVTKVALIQGREERIDLVTNKNDAITTIKQASAGGAELALFSEEAFTVFYDEENEMKETLIKSAKENGIYVIAGLEVCDKNEEILTDNKLLCISPEGEILYDYTKSILVPIVETNSCKKGDENINHTIMKFGNNENCKVSSVICYEGEFTSYINKIDADTDIHLNPSWEWPSIKDYHTNSIILRGVEHGFSVLKATYGSPATASDYYGRLRTYLGLDEANYNDVSFAYVPSKGVSTIYGHFGYIIDWSYVAFMTIIVIVALKEKRSHKKTKRK